MKRFSVSYQFDAAHTGVCGSAPTYLDALAVAALALLTPPIWRGEEVVSCEVYDTQRHEVGTYTYNGACEMIEFVLRHEVAGAVACEESRIEYRAWHAA